MSIKKIVLILLICTGLKAIAQTRYLDDTYFSTVQIDSVVPYGSNLTYTLTTQNLYLDVYQPPVSDTVSARPLIIWIHGGGYTLGSRTDDHIVLWCNEFARRGYVSASIDYRLGIGNPDGKLKAIYRSVQDAKAAIRFFRANASLYKIDVNKIVLAGSSVGAFTAIHTAYWDTDELPTAIDTADLGNLEGDSGNPGYPSNPNAVVNFWGAIKDTTWIDADEPMIVSCAGTLDSVVYPGSHTWASGDEHGSIVIDRVARSKNITDTLRMFIGAKHTLAGLGTGADQQVRWDTATTLVADFLYCNLISICNVTGLIEQNNNAGLSVYPNPGNATITIHAATEWIGNEYTMTDALGRVVLSGKIMLEKTIVSIESLVPGMYYFQLTGKSNEAIKLMKN